MEEVIGQPIKGKADCYRPGRGDSGLPVGTFHRPQGEEGPVFKKESATNPLTGEPEGFWRHVYGEPARLFDSAFGDAIKGMVPY